MSGLHPDSEKSQIRETAASAVVVGVGDNVVVYVPWSHIDILGPYWQGRVTAMLADGVVRIQRDGAYEPCDFHRRWVYPEKMRGKVKVVGKKNPRLRPSSKRFHTAALAASSQIGNLDV